MTESIGAFFQQFRKERHLTLDQAANGLNPASISYFERGKSDISLSNATKLMFNIGMGPYDLNDFLASSGQCFPVILSDVIADDRAAIQAKVAAYLADSPFAPNLQAQYQAALPWLNCTLTDDKPLPPAYEQHLAQLLAYPAFWHAPEQFLVVATLPFASYELLSSVWAQLAALTGKQLGFQNNNLWLVGSIAISRNDAALRQQVASDLQRIIEIPALVAHFNNAMPQLQAIIDLAKGESIDPITDALARMQAAPLASWLTRLAARCQRDQPCHYNTALKPTDKAALAVPADHALLVGPTLALRRKQLGLTLADVADGWSTPAQSRFEQGKTQLAFLNTLTLLRHLGLPLSSLEMSSDSVSLFRQYHIKLEYMGRQADTAGYTRQDFFTVLAEFAALAADFPAGLRIMLNRGLRTVLQWQDLALFPADDPMFADLSDEEQTAIITYLQSLDHLGSLEAEGVSFAVNSITQPFLIPFFQAVTAALPRHTWAEQAIYDMAASFVFGAVFFSVPAIIPLARNFFTPDKCQPYSWWSYGDIATIRTLGDSYLTDSPAVRAQAAQHLADVRLLNPYDGAAAHQRWWFETYAGKGRQDIQA
ncbi:helix-turn-helix domain-containing protein [Lacticaseibacillus daqingensis]|uniref:helix-turn-helix domain-containing protein n=1 Tax=Lacticaseibacillus daqingensis TaxID=2486014 RepID=UPI000F78820E|nr:helix-turn-helix transcriptional regulator [Lacticaseibacillus daqingensis]